MEYIKLIRPYSWIKNTLIFIPLFFAKQLFFVGKLETVFVSFILFCLVASCVYIINDLIDIKQDRLHPTKRNRPLASNKITRKNALLLLASLLVLSIFLLFYVNKYVAIVMGIYFTLNLIYSSYLKHTVIIDILLVVGFYLARVIVGGIAAQVVISNWLIPCIMFIALFLIAGKRRAEMSQEFKRKVLEYYSIELLNSIVIISAALILVYYSLYTVLVLTSPVAVYSIFFVLIALLRYLMLIYTTNKVEYPERALFTDYWIVFSIIGWIVSMFYILYK